MIVINPNSQCDEAKPYYYDYLNNHKEDIPLNVSQHIDECSFCQSEIGRLSQIINENECLYEGRKQVDAIITTSIKLHFAYKDTMVNCQNVKPFLPGLADPLLKIRIPTPITVHIDNCEKCKESLKIIRSLNLNHKQLCTLAQIFAEPLPRKELCIKALEFIPHVVSFSLNKTNSETLKHICICPDCREQLYYRRDLIRKELLKSGIRKENFPCESVQPTDIFDYCFPYGIEVENDQYAKFRLALTSHISVCATCLNKMQELQRTIIEILESTNSGVITYYKINSNRKIHVGNTEDMYKEWPIEVKVYDSLQDSPIETLAERKTKVFKHTHVRKLVKVLSVAAVILFFFILYFNTPSAKAIGLNQICSAISKLQNIYFATYVSNEDIPIEEKWISASLDMILLKTKSRIVLWNIDNKIQESIDLQKTNSQIVRSDYEDWDGIKNMLTAPWGLLPFSDISDVPENSNAKWQKIENEIVDITIENTEIYELTWREQSRAGLPVFRKWRGYVEVDSKLLKRCEFLEKIGTAEEYDLRFIKVVEYPSVHEMEQQIKNAGF